MWGATLLLLLSVVRFAFQFTHPVWGATIVPVRFSMTFTFQFTHPVWGATQMVQTIVSGMLVSIHAPRVGCDCDAQRYALVED